MKRVFKRKMNLEDSEDEEEGESDNEDDEEETPKKGKPNPLVVTRWKMILPKKGEVGKRIFIWSWRCKNNNIIFISICAKMYCFWNLNFLRCQRLEWKRYVKLSSWKNCKRYNIMQHFNVPSIVGRPNMNLLTRLNSKYKRISARLLINLGILKAWCLKI